MGAWSTGPFDNDSAADWAGELTEASPAERLRLLNLTLQAVVPGSDSSGENSGAEWGPEEAIAAAAVVAAALPVGPAVDATYGPPPAVIDSLRVDEQLRALALHAVQEATSEGSEWHDVWSGADALDDALDALRPVISALRQPCPLLTLRSSRVVRGRSDPATASHDEGRMRHGKGHHWRITQGRFRTNHCSQDASVARRSSSRRRARA